MSNKNKDLNLETIRQELDALKTTVETDRSNIVLLNSVFSSINKYLTFLQEDLRAVKANLESYINTILKTNQQQLEVLKALYEQIKQGSENVNKSV